VKRAKDVWIENPRVSGSIPFPGTEKQADRDVHSVHVVHQKQGLGYSRGTGMSGCLERYEHDGIVRMCLHDVADHAGPHADADGCWLVDGKVTVVDPVYRARWSSRGEGES